MRKIQHEQMQVGEIDISSIVIELDSRDEIPQLLRGLQHIYSIKPLRKKVFKILSTLVPEKVSKNTGRNGMSLWNIFVLGTLRLNCNWDYDKLQEIANNHNTLRQMLGHGILDIDKRYPRQTLCDNIRWFTPEILDSINRLVVEEGHRVLGVSAEDALHARCDSFVVETDVHYPTDINLLWDASRKALQLSHRLAEEYCIDGWRQTRHNLVITKRLFRQLQRSRDKDKKSSQCLSLTKQYIEMANDFFERARTFIAQGKHAHGWLFETQANEIEYYVTHGLKLIDQIRRRCLLGEKISHEEKIFSLFEPYTEWISKGKAGVPQELGLRVGIVECDSGFILHHRVMIKETDDQTAVPMITATKKNFPHLKSCSFDKGYHSPKNQEDLAEILDAVILPRKGKLDATELQHETDPQFALLRRKHSAVESAINALENHSLDRCPDYGLDGFKRYVALAVVARNIQLLGRILQIDLLEERERQAA